MFSMSISDLRSLWSTFHSTSAPTRMPAEAFVDSVSSPLTGPPLWSHRNATGSEPRRSEQKISAVSPRRRLLGMSTWTSGDSERNVTGNIKFGFERFVGEDNTAISGFSMICFQNASRNSTVYRFSLTGQTCKETSNLTKVRYEWSKLSLKVRYLSLQWHVSNYNTIQAIEWTFLLLGTAVVIWFRIRTFG